jgi:hypothetical protein
VAINLIKERIMKTMQIISLIIVSLMSSFPAFTQPQSSVDHPVTQPLQSPMSESERFEKPGEGLKSNDTEANKNFNKEINPNKRDHPLRGYSSPVTTPPGLERQVN